LGFYGVMSYRVARRTSEIGIRMALGATRANVRRLILRQTLLIVVLGVIPGFALTEIAAHAAASLLYSTAASNWSIVALAAVVLAGVGILATLVPAQRASRVEPMEALRAE
jgi:putative ABC transport system permease protein